MTRIDEMLEALAKDPRDLSTVGVIARDIGYAAPAMTATTLAAFGDRLEEAAEQSWPEDDEFHAASYAAGALVALADFASAYVHRLEADHTDAMTRADLNQHSFKYHVLMQIADGVSRNRDLARALDRTPQQVNTARRQLQELGLVEPVQVDDGDKKASHYALTPAGRYRVGQLRRLEAPESSPDESEDAGSLPPWERAWPEEDESEASVPGVVLAGLMAEIGEFVPVVRMVGTPPVPPPTSMYLVEEMASALKMYTGREPRVVKEPAVPEAAAVMVGPTGDVVESAQGGVELSLSLTWPNQN